MIGKPLVALQLPDMPHRQTRMTRGAESWASIYVALGFTLSIDGTAISMIPLFPWKLAVDVVVRRSRFFFFSIADGFRTSSWAGRPSKNRRLAKFALGLLVALPHMWARAWWVSHSFDRLLAYGGLRRR